MEEFELIGPNDHPALLAINTPELLEPARAALLELGYKVHAVETFQQFEDRFNLINYEAVLIEEIFGGAPLEGNLALRMIQNLSMPNRRHATFFLIGATFETLNGMHAFSQSVQCVINYNELQMLGQLIHKTVSENTMFL